MTIISIATNESTNIRSIALLFFYLGFGLVVMTILVMLVTCGAYLSGKIINRLSFIERWSMYDLISITPDGGEQGLWLMARIIYQNTRLLKIIHHTLAIASVIIIGLFLSQGWGLDIIRFSLVYIWFAQGVVLGYLIGLWACYLKTDVTNRVVAGIGLFIGIQLILALTISILMVSTLGNIFIQMRWDNPSLLGWIQFFGIILFIEIMVRLMLRLLARQTGLPYSVWCSEVGI
ncbi:MAG: hypothetical protein KJ043_08050 [Anaerolineae bacterium]|nr:hypothetical protein [Anaerolineae bacterium]